MSRFARVIGSIIGCAALGLVVGAAALYVYLARTERPLQLWHTETLTGEFTAEQANDLRSLDDYMRLEDRLFAQLQEKIYARTGIGPAYALVRYSAGSAADPKRRDPNWNRTFELRADAPLGGVLLLHGLTDSPYSLRALGQALNRRGYWVLGLRLPGHGTAPSALLTVTWEDMAAAVRLGMSHLKAKLGEAPIQIVGYSAGAPLALDYTLNALQDHHLPAPASLILISPAIAVSRAAALAKWMNRLAIVPGFQALAWTQILPEFDPYKYNSFTSNAGYQMHRMTRSVKTRIESRAASGPIQGFPPTLVFLSTVDATVSAGAVVDNLLEHLAPERHELVLFDLNRKDIASTVMISDPGPLTNALMTNDALPFALTLIANESADSTKIVRHHKTALSPAISTEPVDLSWPPGVISLSHVALPFPTDDPLYGQRPRSDDGTVFLGQIAVKGERGLLLFPADWLLRLRHNPFYELLERRALEWIENSADRTRPVAADPPPKARQ